MKNCEALLYTITKLIAERDRIDHGIQAVMSLYQAEVSTPIAGPSFAQEGGAIVPPKPVTELNLPIDPAPISAPIPGKPFAGMILWKAAEKMLQAEGGPMGLTEMEERLKRGGIEHKSKNLCGNLGQTMRGKPDRFKETSRGIYELNRDVDHSLTKTT